MKYTRYFTQIHFCDRRSQHQRDVKNKMPSNGLYAHLKENKGHKIYWEGFVYLDSERNWKRRKIKEAIYINVHRLHKVSTPKVCEKFWFVWSLALAYVFAGFKFETPSVSTLRFLVDQISLREHVWCEPWRLFLSIPSCLIQQTICCSELLLRKKISQEGPLG